MASSSLRIDLADIGDSRPLEADGPPIVHYHPCQLADPAAAPDVVEARGFGAGAVVTAAPAAAPISR
ncbi:MAG: hypothetical protein HPM95_04885 [Alphaproteobacteria bacterium]|nr:hypothetical protein [Alphaproteobacteria bacterium]